jgi:hypothetical protein
MIYRGAGFLAVPAVYDLVLLYPLSPPLPAVSSTATHRKTEKERQLADGRGGRGWGEEQNHTTAESLVLYKSYSTLSSYSFIGHESWFLIFIG